MISPGQNPDEDKQAPNGHSSTLGVLGRNARRLRDRTTRWMRAVLAALRAKIGARSGAGARYRVPTRTRSLQLVVAAAVAGVLGVVIGHGTGPPPQQTAGQQPAQPAVAEESMQVRPAAADISPATQLGPARTGPAPSGPAPRANPIAQPGPPPKDQLDGWIQQAHHVLRSQGYPPDKLDPQDTRSLIENESGGDPQIVNNWDSNAQKGTPSKGLMQTIDPTFQAFSLPGHKDIFNPVDNIIAASRYSINDYGSMSNVPGVASMQSGGSYQGY